MSRIKYIRSNWSIDKVAVALSLSAASHCLSFVQYSLFARYACSSKVPMLKLVGSGSELCVLANSWQTVQRTKSTAHLLRKRAWENHFVILRDELEVAVGDDVGIVVKGSVVGEIRSRRTMPQKLKPPSRFQQSINAARTASQSPSYPPHIPSQRI